MITLRKRRSADVLSVQCAAGDQVGDLVRLVSVEAGGPPAVEKVDPLDIAKMPAYGILIEKYGATAGVVQVSGAVDLPAGALQPGKVCFVGTDGRPTVVPPKIPGVSAVVQVVGLATGAQSIQLAPSFAVVQSVA
jgi:hypothetical protein